MRRRMNDAKSGYRSFRHTVAERNSSDLLAAGNSSWDKIRPLDVLRSFSSPRYMWNTSHICHNRSIEFKQMSEGAKLHGHGPVHSFLWRVTDVCGFESVPVHSFIHHWFRAHSDHIIFPLSRENSIIFKRLASFHTYLFSFHLISLLSHLWRTHFWSAV